MSRHNTSITAMIHTHDCLPTVDMEQRSNGDVYYVMNVGDAAIFIESKMMKTWIMELSAALATEAKAHVAST